MRRAITVGNIYPAFSGDHRVTIYDRVSLSCPTQAIHDYETCQNLPKPVKRTVSCNSYCVFGSNCSNLDADVVPGISFVHELNCVVHALFIGTPQFRGIGTPALRIEVPQNYFLLLCLPCDTAACLHLLLTFPKVDHVVR